MKKETFRYKTLSQTLIKTQIIFLLNSLRNSLSPELFCVVSMEWVRGETIGYEKGNFYPKPKFVSVKKETFRYKTLSQTLIKLQIIFLLISLRNSLSREPFCVVSREWVRGETIGQGSFSTVSLATPSNVKDSGEYPSLMAVKSADSYGAASLASEKSVLDSLGDCPEIVRCYGEDQTVEKGEKLHNLLLEYASRGSLATQLKKLNGEGLPEATVRRYTGSVLRGLRHIHAKGFAHCDIKPGNILLFGDGAVKIADFGLARKVDGDLTESKEGVEIRGTPLYMAPESVYDNEYGTAADVWALGCAVVEMFSGKTAWSVKEGSNFMSLLLRIGVSDELPKTPEELSEEGKDFLSKCFVKDPDERWTAEMLLNHPFVAVDCEDDDGQREELFVKVKEEEVSTSPRCPFGFPDWDSMSSDSDTQYQPLDSPVERFESLVSEPIADWSVSGNWVTVR